MAEYLQGREILTVAQDGSGKYRSLTEAFLALKPGQVVKILDQGPYRERLAGPVPADIGIVSEVGTRIELPEWTRVGTGDGAKRYDGWSFTNPEGLRLAGLEFHFPQPPTDFTNQDFLVALNIDGAPRELDHRLVPAALPVRIRPRE